MRVLIVDDTSFMRSVIRNIVEEIGYEVCGEASNGYEAVSKYEDLKPDLVILDVIMPEKNGLDALDEIKGLDRDSKVIICSAMGQVDYVKSAVIKGALDFIVKPFDPNVMIDTIMKVMSVKN